MLTGKATDVTDVVSQICYQCSVTTTVFRVGSREHDFVNREFVMASDVAKYQPRLGRLKKAESVCGGGDIGFYRDTRVNVCCSTQVLVDRRFSRCPNG